jgi:2-oxoacid dehydrogenases acyltransferase (catalytic domain)
LKSEYETSSLARARWNVLDLLRHISTRAMSISLFCDIDVEAADRICKLLSTPELKITITAFLLKAIAVAQLRHPNSRAYRLPDGTKVTASEPVAGFTVERVVEGAPAVFLGTIDGPHTKGLAEIAAELQSYGKSDLDQVPQLAKADFYSKLPWPFRKLCMLVGVHFPSVRKSVISATFGLTSLGKYGMQTLIAPSITTSIFGIGAIESKAVVKGKKIQVRKLMNVCFSADALVLNIYQAARFMRDVKKVVESGLAGYLTREELEQIASSKKQENKAAA